MDAEQMKMRSGLVVVLHDADADLLLLTCERHVVEHAVPLRWPHAASLLRDFLDRHLACQEADAPLHVGQNAWPVTA